MKQISAGRTLIVTWVAFAIISTVLALLAGCTTPITKSGSGVTISSSGVIGKDLIAAGFDLDQAVLVGALAPTDPAVGCIHGVLDLAGLSQPICTPAVAPATEPVCPPAPASFVPENKGAVSAGAIVYIHAQQLKGLQGIQVPVDCQAIVGQFVINGLSAPNKVLFPFLPSLQTTTPIIAPK